MLQLTIKKEKFLDWYFNYGQEQEIKDIQFDLANNVIEQLYKYGFSSISVKQLFDDCNKDSIRAYFTCEFLMQTDEYDIELQDLNKDYTITLI